MAATQPFDRPNRPLTVYAGLFTLFLYIPILFIPLFSFNSGLYARFPLQEFTLVWYAELWTRGPVFAALQNSLQVGVTVAVISTVLALSLIHI